MNPITMGNSSHVLIFIITVVVKPDPESKRAEFLNLFTLKGLNGQCNYSGDKLVLDIVASNMFLSSVANRSTVKLVVC